MPAKHAIECRRQTNARIKLLPPTLKRALCFGIQLSCFLFCFAAFGANEIYRVFNYKGFDTNGNLLVSGVITLRLDGTTKVTGDWTLQVLDKSRSKEMGPQDGSGKILGQLKGDRIFLNLNPGVFGDNVYLDGEVSQANIFKIKGKWGRYGFYSGKIIEGDFEMLRK
jgi:hypothetical protein